MKKNKNITFVSHRELKRKLMKNHAFKKAYNDLDFEFKIIKALIRARVEKNITQKELAQNIGIAQSALARFESGRINPRLSFLKKVTHGLGLTLTVK